MRYTPLAIAVVALLLLAAATGCLFADNEPATPTPDLPATIAAAVARAVAAQATTEVRQADAPTATFPAVPELRQADVPTATIPSAPELRHLEAKRYMLELINAERVQAGLNPVALGDNIAAQLHAENSLADCYSSHWGTDGLKPYMRYSLAGGYQSNGENGSGNDYCIKASDGYRAIDSVKSEINDAMAGWMRSAGHRSNILDPWHKKVNIGIAYDRYNALLYQHFEGDYVEYDRMPEIANGIRSLSGTTKNGAQFSKDGDLGVQIYYDPPPHDLAGGQVARTYCYDNGRQLAALREPLTGGYYWPTHEFTKNYQPCPSPYDVPSDTPAPRSADEAHQVWEQAYHASQSEAPQTITVPWITASEWTASDKTFAVQANISELLRQRGDGVYSVMVWGKIDGADAVISQHSIFHGLTPPDTYTDH